MSSRALRKLQREEEEKRKQLQHVREEAEDEESEEEQASAPKVLNAFEMLNTDQSDEGTEPEDSKTGEDDAFAKEFQADLATSSAANPKPKRSKKKKKKKSKKKEKQVDTTMPGEKNSSAADDQLDEIDLALKSLSTKSEGNTGAVAQAVPLVDPAHIQLHRLLAVESKHLNALNEMKRLFGSVVLENEDEAPGTPRRRGRGPQQLDLGSALTARNSPVARGQGLTGLALRRNFLMQGKEEWPKAAGGGLGMELVEKLDDGTIEYRFVHNTVYQDVQRQFMSCVESMDPQRMISMLMYNPYHVSTLLQVSEIAKQQGDYSVSGDLLERALFTFGRSVQSSFTNALAEGKARLNFDRPENREFWLAAWRYMNNLGQRGTWRTAYEWAKLILSLDPELDPYCIHKVIDQLALRSGQFEHFMKLSARSSLLLSEVIWQRCPNIAISTALVESRLERPQECRASLQEAIQLYPWVFARLFQELNLDHVPKSIWGTTPRTPREKLDCESYVALAKDVWNTPEATSLLVEVASYATPIKSQPHDSRPITLDEARHALLSGIPAIIDCIPRSFTTQSTSSFDPFPPPENLPSYSTNPDGRETGDQNRLQHDEDDDNDRDDPPLPPNLDHLEIDAATARGIDARSLQSFFSRFIPWLGRSEAATGENDASAAPGPSNEMEAAIANSAREAHEAGLSAAEIQERGNRLLEVLGHANVRERDQSADDHDHDENHPFPDAVEDDNHLLDLLLGTATPPTAAAAAAATTTAAVAAGGGGLNQTEAPPNNSTPRAAIEAATTTTTTPTPRIRNDNPDILLRSYVPSPSPPHSDTENEPEPIPPPGRHWLAGRGILLLKAYTDAHGTDPTQWPPPGARPASADDSPNDGEGSEGEDVDVADGRALLRAYVAAIMLLPEERDRRFILNFALPQGAGEEVTGLVLGEVRRLMREGLERGPEWME